LRDTKSPRLRDADSISGPIRLCGAADPVELRLRNNTDIGPHIVATNADIPEFDAYFAGGFDEEASPLGAKGLGKLTAAASAAPAIADAVCHATGKRIRDLPVAAELLHAMPYDGMQNTYAHDQKERSPCLDQSNLTFSCLAVGRAASLSLGTWRNRDDGLPSLKDVGSAAHVRTSPACQARTRSQARGLPTRHGAAGTMAR